MSYNEFKLRMRDGKELNIHKWTIDDEVKPRGVIQIIHGMAEHGKRYDRFARELLKEGYVVYADDHRGHGKSADSIKDLGYICDKDGFHTMVHDENEINQFIKKENPGLKVYVFGHSMGSFLSQRYMELYGDTIDGVILSGTNGKPSVTMKSGIILSWILMMFTGRKGSGKVMDKAGFGNYNDKYEKVRTQYDWLSRDEAEVDKYIEDSFCGGIFPVSFFYDFLRGLSAIHKKKNLSGINPKVPVQIISGDMDPVGFYGEGVKALYRELQQLGVENVNCRLYEGARHEILNEINRDEVTSDIIKCLNTWTGIQCHESEKTSILV